MALQDLTPQLRTRLGRVERVVGWFVLLAVALLVTGFAFYVWSTAQRKGWFVEKVAYSTCLNTAAGVKAGDPVKLMGFKIGEVTKVMPNGPFDYYNVTIFFDVWHDTNGYVGYIWTDSRAKVATGDLLGNRFVEIIKGQTGVPVHRIDQGKLTGQLRPDWKSFSKKMLLEGRQSQDVFKATPEIFYVPYTNSTAMFLEPEESPALGDRLEKVVSQAEAALPNLLGLTNQIQQVLSNAVRLTSNIDYLISGAQPVVTNANHLVTNLNALLADARPILTNLQIITTTLTNSNGSLGQWLLPPGIPAQVGLTLTNVNTLLHTADTNLNGLSDSIGLTLVQLADITSNLNRQVQANTNMLSDISGLVTNADYLMQGLRRHWLLRSAFKTNAPPPVRPTTPVKPILRSSRQF